MKAKLALFSTPVLVATFALAPVSAEESWDWFRPGAMDMRNHGTGSVPVPYQIKHTLTSRCLETDTNLNTTTDSYLYTAPCDENKPGQKWWFNHAPGKTLVSFSNEPHTHEKCITMGEEFGQKVTVSTCRLRYPRYFRLEWFTDKARWQRLQTYSNPTHRLHVKYKGRLVCAVPGKNNLVYIRECGRLNDPEKMYMMRLSKTPPIPTPAPTPTPTLTPSKPKQRGGGKTKKGSSSGDPHMKTWTGDKYDYHGECDLVLVDNPSFADGLGLKLHIRTTRVKYFSFIERAALQIGNDVLEFANDVDNFLVNGAKVKANQKHQKTKLGPYVVRRDPKAISVRLHDGTGLHQKAGAAKIDFIQRMNGFPAVIVDGGSTDIFRGSLGLLGEWETGKTMARNGTTEMAVNGVGDEVGATAFALEWQVRDNEPMLFKESRFPQYPTVCTPPAKITKENRLGASHFKKEAEEACAHWKEDMDDCLFDVMATSNLLVAHEGHHDFDLAHAE